MSDFDIYTPESDLSQLKDLIKQCGERLVIRKGECFLRAGEIGGKIAYIEQGGFKCVRKDSRGNERIFAFMFEDELIADYIPYRNKKPVLLDIQAMEDGVIYCTPIENLRSFFETEIDGDIYVRKFVETIAYQHLQRIVSVVCETPEERYIQLQKRVPDIFYRVNLKDIAAYIGVRPETLSRMRTSFLRKDSTENT